MLNIDEAIQHCLEQVAKYERQCEFGVSQEGKEFNSQCAADHRQLAKWLMELKDARSALNDVEVEINELLGELKEAKRLLRLAMKDVKTALPRASCTLCKLYDKQVGCTGDIYVPCGIQTEWRYADEAEKLIGDINDDD